MNICYLFILFIELIQNVEQREYCLFAYLKELDEVLLFSFMNSVKKVAFKNNHILGKGQEITYILSRGGGILTTPGPHAVNHLTI